MKQVPENANHRFLAEELMVPNADKADSNRLYMFSGHLAQCANLKNPEFPLIFTNFEDSFGKYSDLGYTQLDENAKVIAKIIKNENVYYLIIQKESGEYDYIERRTEFWLTEKYGFTFNNEKIDKVIPGDNLNKDEKLIKCFNYDENDNFMYGVNLRTIFYTEKCKTLEDAIVISKSGAEKLKSYNVEKVTIVLNGNDLLLNLDKTGEDYITFPDINENIESYLAVRRRIDNKKLYSFDDLTINSIRADDEKFFVKGKVVDIDIYSNIDEKELDAPHSKQLKRTIKKRKKFNSDLLKVLDPIVTSGAACSNQLIQLYNNVKMEQDKIPFSYENSIFSGIVIQFTILKENNLVMGSKISGRYGNKGVISEIREGDEAVPTVIVVDDDKMPIIKSGPFKGLRTEVCLNPLGVINRINPAQLYEQEFNFIAMYIKLKIKESKTREEKEKWYFDFINDINPNQYKFTKEWYSKLNDEQKDEFLKECEDKIYIHQEPFYNRTDLQLLCDLYDKYDFIQPFEFEGINIPLIMGEMYFLRLKHDPAGKLSARSTGFENLKNSPSKSKDFKYKKSNISKTPIRLGNMEILNLLLTGDSNALDRLLSSYSTNEDAKLRELEALTLGDPYDINVDLEDIGRNETQKLADTLFFELGLEFKDFEEDYDEE